MKFMLGSREIYLLHGLNHFTRDNRMEIRIHFTLVTILAVAGHMSQMRLVPKREIASFFSIINYLKSLRSVRINERKNIKYHFGACKIRVKILIGISLQGQCNDLKLTYEILNNYKRSSLIVLCFVVLAYLYTWTSFRWMLMLTFPH